MPTLKITLLSIFLMFFMSSKAISLKDAIKQKLITVTIKGERGESSHFGKCIGLTIKNLTSKKIEIELLPGMFLNPADSTVQRMMVAEELLISLNPSTSKKMTINAFCTQMSKSSPSNDLKFNVGRMAKGHLLELSKLISKHKFFTKAGQNAVWCISDNNDLFSINSIDTTEIRILREFVHKATGQPLNQVFYQAQRSSSENRIFRDTIIYANREGGTFSLIMFTEDGEEMIVLFKDRYRKPSFKTTQSFSLTYSSFPVGKYYFRLTKNNTEVIYNKEIVIKAVE